MAWYMWLLVGVLIGYVMAGIAIALDLRRGVFNTGIEPK